MDGSRVVSVVAVISRWRKLLRPGHQKSGGLRHVATADQAAAAGSAPLDPVAPPEQQLAPTASHDSRRGQSWWWGTGAVGLTGPGAVAAARGVLHDALCTSQAGERSVKVFITAEAMVALVGVDQVALGGWPPKLHVVSNVAKAMPLLHARLMAARRHLADSEQPDPVAPNTQSEAVPVLLIAHVPAADLRRQLWAVTDVSRSSGEAAAVLLGRWDLGATVHIDLDGGTGHVSGQLNEAPTPPARLPVPSAAATGQALRRLGDAHATALRRSVASGINTTWPGPQAGDDEPGLCAETGSDTEGQSPQPQAPLEPDVRATVRVLGTPQVDNASAAGRPVRRAALQLLVYLAVHRDGATVEQILDDLWPDTRRSLAGPRLHTATSNLRHILAVSAGTNTHPPGGYVQKEHRRYRLNAEAVEVDLWALQRSWAFARNSDTPQQRYDALRATCAAYIGPLAEGYNHEWIISHREGARRIALEAHTSLAAMVAEQDPVEAARLLTKAVEFDPAGEDTYRQAMRACYRIGDAEAIRVLQRQLADQLDTVDAAPEPQTVELAEHLVRDLDGS